MKERTKSRSEVVVTSYGRNRDLEEIKNQETANNSLYYRFAIDTEQFFSAKNCSKFACNFS